MNQSCFRQRTAWRWGWGRHQRYQRKLSWPGNRLASPRKGGGRTPFLGNINDTKTVLAIFYNFENDRGTFLNLPSEEWMSRRLAENFSPAPLDAGDWAEAHMGSVRSRSHRPWVDTANSSSVSCAVGGRGEGIHVPPNVATYTENVSSCPVSRMQVQEQDSEDFFSF